MGRFRTAGAVAATLGLMPVAAVVAPFGVPHAQAATTDLFFSEYIEGSSNNKALEIYNGTGAAVDLATDGYNVQMSFNGGTLDPHDQPDGHGRRRRRLRARPGVGQRDDPRPGRPDERRGLVQRRRRRRAPQGHDRPRRRSARSASTPAPSGARPHEHGRQHPPPYGSHLPGRRRRTDAFDPSAEWDGFATDTFDGLGSAHGRAATSDVAPERHLDHARRRRHRCRPRRQPHGHVQRAGRRRRGSWFTISCATSGAHTATRRAAVRRRSRSTRTPTSRRESCAR